MVKTYTFFNNVRVGLSKPLETSASGVIDFFSTLNTAKIFWESSNNNLTSIKLNGEKLSGDSNGSINVINTVKNGVKNTVSLGVKTLGANPVVKCYLVVEGVLATFGIVQSQNQQFINAYRTGVITKSEYMSAVTFQNQVAYNMLQAGIITTAQLNDLLLAQIASDLPKVDPPTADKGDTNLDQQLDEKKPSDENENTVIEGKKPLLTRANVAIGGVFVTVLIVIIVIILRGGKK
ncbi:MAG: hypothetical protein FWC33_06105 [Candidatus Bathyarchaeota archaeon]|nr:hypothetical protein [Candidatus Termiticorpusculum sp.]